MIQKLLLALLLFLSFQSISQTKFPGGVAGAEVWYNVDHDDFIQDTYRNLAREYLRISACPENAVSRALYNFNHSLRTEKLCLHYVAPLENTIARNVFFVGEQEIEPIFGHLTTRWSSNHSALIPTGVVTRNRFDMAYKGVYVNNNTTFFEPLLKQSISFYNWNIYQTDKKFKSFGIDGETEFYIGKDFIIPDPETPSEYYRGNFPEFISFPFELTADQKNRVESYLALKYGITLKAGTTYRNARNTKFWNAENYSLFGSRIFGIGRDDISGLNQLESESVHNKDYLIASVEKLMPTNKEKQQLVSIQNNNFLVFGDNNQPDGLTSPNDHNVRRLFRIWLSQNTGSSIKSSNIFFKVNLLNAMSQALSVNPQLKLWMLHDPYVTSQEQSDFTSPYVEYYQPADMNGIVYGFFEDVYFDTDNGVFDQFTFGVGPEMIVQVRFEEDCDDERIKSYVVITGGEAPYKIKISNTNGYSENFVTNDTTMAFEAIAPDTYTVVVLDNQGNTAQIDTDVILPQIAVDLGPDIVFNSQQQQTTLNAGTNVMDPDATYNWYFNGSSMGINTPSITVSQPGEYTVEVISGNRICRVTDTILIRYNFGGTAYPAVQCEAEDGGITFTLTGGVPPFTSVVSGNYTTISQVHNTLTYQFTELPFDNYTLTTTDSQGNVFQTNVDVEDLLEGVEVDLAAQISPNCPDSQNFILSPNYIEGTAAFECETSFNLDASALVTAPNVSYEWFVNGVSLNVYDPQVLLHQDLSLFNPYPYKYNIITVELYNLDTGCSLSQTVVLEGPYGVSAAGGNTPVNTRTAAPAEEGYISAKVYPNPAAINTTFYYEIVSDKVIEGTVHLYSPTGAVLYETKISGKSSYQIPLNLLTSGTYLISTTTADKTLTNKIIIK